MTRSRAALTHLWPSLLVLAGFAGLLLLLWFPYPFRQFAESDKFALALILSATLIGPAMTWLVYKPGKRGLLLDLVIISLIQLAAFGWGAMSLYQNRPYFMVFTVDILLFANMPTDPAAYQKLLREVMFEGKPDLQFRPEFWSLYADSKEQALQKSRPLADLRAKRPDSGDAIDRLVNRHGGDIARFRFVPALFGDAQYTVILDAASGDVVGSLLISPWLD